MSESRAPEVQDEYEDLLGDAEHRWRGRLIASVVLLTLLVAGVLTLWMTVLRGGGPAANVTQPAKVQRGSIMKTVSTSATTLAQSTANLSFGQSGKVTAVNVKLGQEVKQGDVLAEIQADSLQNAVANAQVNLANAQAKLNTLLQGSTASQLTSADQSVVQAQASYDQAVRDLQDLSNPPTASALSAAQQAVTQAQAQVTQAQNARTKLDTTSSDAVTAAEAAVEKARSALDSAERAATNAAADYQDCQASPPASDLTCRTALAKKEDTADAVDLAEDDLATAKDNLDTAKDGPTTDEIASAEAAITSAQQGLDTANAKLAELTAGPTQEEVAQAQDKVSTAAAGLSAAQAKRDEVYAGSTAADIQAQQSQVQLATLSLAQAKKALEGAQIIAPFDGTVAALNINVGDTAGVSSSSTSAPIILNTPNAVVLNLSIGESDLPSVKAGLSGTAQFDAITGVSFPIVIDSVGTNPTTTQGVVTYQARAHIVSGQGAKGATSGLPASPPAEQTPSPRQIQGTPNAVNAVSAVAKPAPGMNASVTIIIDQRQDVLVVSASAIQRDGRDSVVDIQNEDGSTERQVVETGLSDGTNTEITSGLEEGQTVIIPSVAATSGQSQSTQGGDMMPIFGGPPGGDRMPGD